MSEQDVDYTALAKEHGGTSANVAPPTTVDYTALAKEHGGTAATKVAPTTTPASTSVDYAALAREHGGQAPSRLDADTAAASARLQNHPIEGAEFHAQPSMWERAKNAVEHPIDYLGEVEEDTQKGGGRTIVGRTLGHMQARGDQGYQADQSGLAPIMAGPLQGPPKIARGALRIAAPPHRGMSAGEELKERVGAVNELSEGAFQTPGALIGITDPTMLPKVIAGGAAQHYTQKGLKALGVPDEYSELAGNVAGVVGAGSVEDPAMLIRGTAKAADVVPGKAVRAGLKKILPTSVSPAIEEYVHVPGKTLGLEPSEKAEAGLTRDVDVAREKVRVLEEKTGRAPQSALRTLIKSESGEPEDLSTSLNTRKQTSASKAGLVESPKDEAAYLSATKELRNAIERQAASKEYIPIDKAITAAGNRSKSGYTGSPDIVKIVPPSEYARRWRTPEVDELTNDLFHKAPNVPYPLQDTNPQGLIPSARSSSGAGYGPFGYQEIPRDIANAISSKPQSIEGAKNLRKPTKISDFGTATEGLKVNGARPATESPLTQNRLLTEGSEPTYSTGKPAGYRPINPEAPTTEAKGMPKITMTSGEKFEDVQKDQESAEAKAIEARKASYEAQRAKPTAPEATTRGNVPDELRSTLKKSGYSDTQIDRMRPDEAQAHSEATEKQRTEVKATRADKRTTEQLRGLSDENLKKIAPTVGIDPAEYDFKARSTDGKRTRTEVQQLAQDITAQLHPEETMRHADNAARMEGEGLWANKDQSAAGRAARSAELFKHRLNGDVDAYGNPTGLEGMSSRELHQNFGEQNKVVTKEEFDAAKKSFTDKSTRSNAGVDPTMLADVAKIAAYYIEGGLRTFSEFASRMVEQLGEAVRPYLPKMYGEISARVEAGVPRTWKGTAREWEGARTQSRLDEPTRELASAEKSRKNSVSYEGIQPPEEHVGETTPSKLERYTDPNGQFYKTVLKELRKATTPDAANDLAQEVMTDFTENVKRGTFKLPENAAEEGRVTNNLKTIARNKAADWADKVSGETAGGTPRNLIETKRMSETATPKNGSTGFPKLGEQVGEDEEVSPNRPEESKSPYGFGEEETLRDAHSNAQRALRQYLEEHPETAAEDKELLLSASKKSLEKAESARSKAYDKELAKYGEKPTDAQVEKAIEAGREAEKRVNSNKFTSTERYFGLTDTELTKLGQAQHMTGTKLRARLTTIMDDLNSRATKGTERPRTGPPSSEGTSGYTNFLSGEGPSRTGFGKITTEKAPTVAKPTDTYGNPTMFGKGTEKPDLAPPLEHAPRRIGGYSKDVPGAGNAGGGSESTGSRALAGPRISHGEAWSLPPKEPVGAGATLPLTEPLPVEKPLIEPEQTSPRGGRTGITPIDMEGAAANRIRQAQDALDNAKTSEEQRRARTALQHAQRDSQRVAPPSIGGGSQGADVNSIADQYLKSLTSKGMTIPKIEAVIPEAGNIIQGVEAEAKRFGVNLRNRGFEQPTEVSHAGQSASAIPKIATSRPTETANLIPEPTSSEIETGANRFNAEKAKAEREPSKIDKDIEALAAARKRLGLRPSFSPTGNPEVVGGKPIEAGPEVERLRARADASRSYREYQQNNGSTFHEVKSADAKGETSSLVSAVSSPNEPNTWTVKGSYASTSGAELGLDSYARLAREAQAAADKSGEPVVLRGDPEVFSTSARSTWRKLSSRERLPVKWSGKGIGDEASRPSITFTPKTEAMLPKSLGGGTAKNNAKMPWMEAAEVA